MEKSFDEINKLLSLMKKDISVFKGSKGYLENENTPVISPAAQDLAKRAEEYSPERPLYVVEIGAITNIASAILLNKNVAENCVVVWLGGHAHHYHDTKEFNMRQDIAAARVVMQSGVPFVQLPCVGVVNSFAVSGEELRTWLGGKNDIADYLCKNTIVAAEDHVKRKYNAPRAWTRIIWDVTAVAWLLNDDDRFMESAVVPAKIPTYDGVYAKDDGKYPIRYVYNIKRDSLMTDLFLSLTK